MAAVQLEHGRVHLVQREHMEVGADGLGGGSERLIDGRKFGGIPARIGTALWGREEELEQNKRKS